MKKSDVLDAMRYAPDHPLWQAIVRVKEDYRAEAIERGKDTQLTDKETNMVLGAITGVDELFQNLEQLIRESRKDT